MKIIELDNNTLKTIDIESRAIIFSDRKDNYKSIVDFGTYCVNLKDEDGDLYVSRWESPDYIITFISEKEFWKIVYVIKDYIFKQITNCAEGKITSAISFWDDWNNRFQIIEVDGIYFGISWWTTA